MRSQSAPQAIKRTPSCAEKALQNGSAKYANIVAATHDLLNYIEAGGDSEEAIHCDLKRLYLPPLAFTTELPTPEYLHRFFYR